MFGSKATDLRVNWFNTIKDYIISIILVVN